MAPNLKKLASTLAKRGPHRVLQGDLAFAGLPGRVYTPAKGRGLPAVAFGHDWRQPVERYHATLRHLASWGIVVAAPGAEAGVVADHSGLASDLETALQVLAGVKLGTGAATVHPDKLILAGHGMGAGCAVLAAADRSHLRAVAAVFPSVVSPSSEEAARTVQVPGLILSPGLTSWPDRGNAAELAAAWGGEVQTCTVDAAGPDTLAEVPLWQRATGLADRRGSSSARELTRGLLTGWLLHMSGDRSRAEFAEL